MKKWSLLTLLYFLLVIFLFTSNLTNSFKLQFKLKVNNGSDIDTSNIIYRINDTENNPINTSSTNNITSNIGFLYDFNNENDMKKINNFYINKEKKREEQFQHYKYLMKVSRHFIIPNIYFMIRTRNLNKNIVVFIMKTILLK